MNVLEVYKTPFPKVEGGVDVVVANLLRSDPNQYRATMLRTVDWTQRHLTRSNIHGIEVYSLHLPLFPASRLSIRGWLACFWRGARALYSLKRLVADTAIDVVHLHTLQHYHLYFVLLRVFGGPPHVITLHGSEVLAYPARGAVTRWLWRRVLRNAAGVVAVSTWLAENARQNFPFVAEIGVIENGVDIEAALVSGPSLRTQLGLPERYCIMIGVYKPYKGHQTALRAWAALGDNYRDIDLVIVGSGELENSYRALIADLGLDGRVHLTGQLEHAEALALARDSVALIMPSRNEGFGLALLEAGVVGVPLICSNIPPFLEMIEPEHTALIFAVDDAAGLRVALQRLFDDAPLRIRLAGALAASVRQRYPVSRMREQYATLFNAVMERPA
jgi:glycosyltransferase involved in cell wall biosynthesis